MPRLQNAEGLDPRGVYKATPLVGHGFYSLQLVEPVAPRPGAPKDEKDEWAVKLDAGLARRLRARARKGESLRDQVQRILLASL